MGLMNDAVDAVDNAKILKQQQQIKEKAEQLAKKQADKDKDNFSLL